MENQKRSRDRNWEKDSIDFFNDINTFESITVEDDEGGEAKAVPEVEGICVGFVCDE